MYESPVKRRMRAAIQDAQDEAMFAEQFVDAIDNNPEVRAAILRLTRRQAAAKTAAPTRGRNR